MLKIIAGKYKGFKLSLVPSIKTKPTSHLIRKVLFDTIGDLHHMTRVLDLFSGSGACAFEALSRYAQSVYLVDNLWVAYQTMKKNKQKLNLTDTQAHLFYGNAFKILWFFIEQKLIFDLILLDPPYEKYSFISLFKNLDIITSAQSWVVYETFHRNVSPQNIGTFSLIKNKKYGSKKLYFYQKKL
ncbi:16S rRNA (guanine(966)-N(2))-methyltransferase RsmD [Candidatus Phytoplasma phoenicium]|uniref:16S rRNA (Guanine(966)-N(2))-methyltransferase RsmD n=1 Tax=Candidatus Phytoplasma phoenicium TaxID=198422 RepID=A0A2S8NVD1_9MOLU|nr:16S rRNA (guanine(966)-N(2))-methyltransferase RsmD [Candidatus Phytoplasma phoenicium]